MKKDVKSILSVSFAAMYAPFSSKIGIPIDLTLDVRDDSGDSDSTNFDDRFYPFYGWNPSLCFLLA